MGNVGSVCNNHPQLEGILMHVSHPGFLDDQGARKFAMRKIFLAIAMAGLLWGCGTRGTIALVEPAAITGQSKRVIVATSRARADAPEYFSSDRDFTTNFARFDVSIPSDRNPGTIRYPKGQPDPSRDFVVTNATSLDGSNSFVAEVNAAAAMRPQTERTGSLFVHGFNTNFAESLFGDAQLRHDLQAPGVDVLFTWPSDAKLVAYVADQENALFSRDALAETLSLMSRTKLTGYNVVAHSMGTLLMMETLRTLALSGDRATLSKINAVILVSADLDVDVFRKQAVPVLAAGLPIYLVVSGDDKALRLSAVIRGQRKRVGQVRSTDELGGLDVAVIDLSEIKSTGKADHMKVGTSPELIAFIQSIQASGVAIFDDGQKAGLFDHGAVLFQGATGVVINSLAQ